MSVRGRGLVISLAGAGAVAAALAGAAASGARAVAHARSVRCASEQIAFNASGSEQLGTVRCGAPLGSGVLQVRTTGRVVGNEITLSGHFRYYFNAGTIEGAYRVAGSTTSGRFSGSGRLTGGSGAYRRAAGRASLSCRSPINSRRTTCTVKLSLSRL